MFRDATQFQAAAVSPAHRRGFTITEILVVIGIIVLVAALAVPAINVLSGARSIDGASNIMSGMLGSARATALARQQTIGLAIFEDKDQQRVGLALVAGPQPWTSGTVYLKGDFVSHTIEIVSGSPETYYFLCHAPHTAGSGDVNDVAPAAVSQRWTRLDKNPATGSTTDSPYPGLSPVARSYAVSEYVSILPESDIVYLPPGVGAQVLNSSRTSATGALAQSDRYLACSVIYFDPDGRMSLGRRFGIQYDRNDSPATTPAVTTINSSRLGLAIRFNQETLVATASTNIDPNATSSVAGGPTTSGLGVVLFDRPSYLAQNFPKLDTQLIETNDYATVRSGDAKSQKESEEWIDANGTLLMINRYNGTVLKAE